MSSPRLGQGERRLLLTLTRLNVVEHVTPSGLALIRAAAPDASVTAAYRPLHRLVSKGWAADVGGVSTGGGRGYRVTRAGLDRLATWATRNDQPDVAAVCSRADEQEPVKALRERLALDLTSALLRLATGTPLNVVLTGSEDLPGVWFADDGDWEAWDRHPFIAARVRVTDPEIRAPYRQ